MIKLSNEREIVFREFKNELKDIIKPEYYIKYDKLEELLEKYIILEDRSETELNKNMLWRLTFPLYLFVIIFIFIFISPFKWLLTGKFYWKFDGRCLTFFKKWANRF